MISNLEEKTNRGMMILLLVTGVSVDILKIVLGRDYVTSITNQVILSINVQS